MESTDLLSLLEDLEENIDDLEENLEPLLAAALSLTTKKLPLLDRAKLYTLMVYSIESLLFSYLRLNGVQAKDHAVFKELTRVKQYFQKIKLAEDGQNPAKPTMSLNKQATGRFIKQALAGNDRYDTERAEREAREKLLAARKAKATASTPPTNQLPQARISVFSEQNDGLEDGEVDDDNAETLDAPTEAPRAGKKEWKPRTKNDKRGSVVADENRVAKPKRGKKKSKKAGFEGDEQQELVKHG